MEIGDELVKRFYLVAVVPDKHPNPSAFYLCGSAEGTKPVLGWKMTDQDETKYVERVMKSGKTPATIIAELMSFAQSKGQQEGVQPCIGTDLATARKQFKLAKERGHGVAAGTLVIVELTGGKVIEKHEFDDSQQEVRA